MKKTNTIFLLLAFCWLTNFVNAQVAISSTPSTPDGSAMLDVKSTTKGLLLPRMGTNQRNASSIIVTVGVVRKPVFLRRLHRPHRRS